MPQNINSGSLTRPFFAPDLQGLKLREYHPLPLSSDAVPSGHLATPALARTSNLPALSTPKSLCIRFSKEADMGQVIALYGGARKQQIDPQGFVRPRSEDEIAHAVRNKAAILALDENGVIRASALASHYHDGRQNRKGMTEIGAVLCDVGGVGLSKTLLAMISLKHSFDMRSNQGVFAKVAQDNEASNAVFTHSLGWDKIKSPSRTQALYDIAYRQKNGARDRLWYRFSENAGKKAVDILRACVLREGLQGKNDRFIPLDLDNSGLRSTLRYNDMLSRYVPSNTAEPKEHAMAKDLV